MEIYKQWYKLEHGSPEYIKEAVYGLPEINRDKIKEARLIANPGCFPTCSFLSTYPLVKEGIIDPNTLIIDAKSGTSGAGRGAKVDSLYCEVNENIKAYGVASTAIRLRLRSSCPMRQENPLLSVSPRTWFP